MCSRHRVVPLARLGLHTEACIHDDKTQRLAAQHVKRVPVTTQHYKTYPASVHSLPGFDLQTITITPKAWPRNTF